MRKKILLASACVLALTACDDNNWNNKLDGFEDAQITDVQSIEYVLTDADYAAIASNATNKAKAEAAGLADELKAVGNNKCFNEAITAQDYIPAFFASTNFPYFALDNGSAVKLTYQTQGVADITPTAIAEASTYKLATADYQAAWGSDEKFVEAFAPSTPASKFVPNILKTQFPDAVEGQYAHVTYNVTEQEPVFGGIDPGPTPPPTPSFEPTSIISSLDVDDEAEIKGYVMGICRQGYILADKSGNVLVYYGSSFDASKYTIGQQVTINGKISAYNRGMQIAGGSATEELGDVDSVTYPTPEVFDAAKMDEASNRTANEFPPYIQFTGTVAVSGNYVNIVVDGATAQGSGYQMPDDVKAQLTALDGQVVTLTGYFVGNTSGRYVNLLITQVQEGSVAPKSRKVSFKAATVTVPTTVTYALYRFDGSKWAVADNAAVLQHADYQKMGLAYDNLSTTATPAVNLPIYLAGAFPYAQVGTEKYVVYYYYASGATTIQCNKYVLGEAGWTLDNNQFTETAQFVKTGNKWMYNPNVTITLVTTRNDPTSNLYYQTCVNWVFENVDKPLGSTDIKSGLYYVTSYGNNEYYCGTSAYQNNLDLRPDKAITQYAAGYEGMSNEEIVALMKKRFAEEVFPGALAQLHPDAAPVPGLEVLYTINFFIYNGATLPCQVVYEVTAPATFTLKSITWGDEAE